MLLSENKYWEILKKLKECVNAAGIDERQFRDDIDSVQEKMTKKMR